ncbi:hypothetical protein [Sansalvadorimonas verongulae]|uniref:hypothetical protein n=1 Tax=Sansalvadorimonas verongulae TaxID=2172824 RepID=UPI0012BBFBAA|nr:hypothetical protein [Sansalvadorimonas verongulae]MTI13080.1 hypothetical protein [Sansalvadorimonas verongulae]
MELILLVIIGGALYIADRYTDFMADQIAGNAFEEVHEVIGSVSYFGQAARPICKQHTSHVFAPLLPSVNHDLKVLCLTDCGHWFWFHANIRFMKLESSKIEVTTSDVAREALKDDPEKLEQFFPEVVSPKPEQEMEHKKSA